MSAHGTMIFSLVMLPLQFWFMGALAFSQPMMLGMMAVVLFVGLPAGWVASFVWTGLLALILLPCLSLCQRWIGTPVRKDTTGWIAGSAVAVIGNSGNAFSYGAIGGPGMPGQIDLLWMVALQALGTACAIVAAQAGGYLGSLRALRRRREVGSRPVHFSVWHLMAGTSILAVFLGVAKLAGPYATPIVISVAVSSAVAVAVHRPVAWATNRWLDWRLKRRRAKRAKTRVLATT